MLNIKMEIVEEQGKENLDSLESIQTRLNTLRRTILTLEWDESRNQINEAKRSKLRELREEFNKLKGLENEAKAKNQEKANQEKKHEAKENKAKIKVETETYSETNSEERKEAEQNNEPLS